MRAPAVLAGCVLLVATACAVPAQHEAQRARDPAVPFGLLDPDAPPLVPPAPGQSSETVALCFVREGHLVVAEQALAAPVSPRAPLDALASPPAEAPRIRSALTDPSIVHEVRLVGGIARVDLLPAVSALPGDEQLLAVAQIVCTLTGRPGIGQVSFTLEGARLAIPKGDGSLVTTPVARDDYAGLIV